MLGRVFAVLLLAFVAAADRVPRQLHVLHRHGARTPIVPPSVNATAVCGEAGCGQLNAQGKDMLEQLGLWLRAHYAELLGAPYNQRVVYSRSTDIDRTLQSASAMLRGAFGPGAFPAIHSVAFEQDTLLLVDAQMSFHVPQAAGKAPHFDIPVVANFTDVLVRSMAAEAGVSAACHDLGSFDKKQACISTVADVAASRRSADSDFGARYPTLAARYALLEEFTGQRRHALFGYNPATSTVDKARGSLGYNLAAHIQGFMFGAAGLGGTDPTPARVFEWSAHDSTLAPFSTAMGHDLMLPLFGQAFVLELSEEAGKWFVRILYGAPGQLPGNHSYSFTDITVACKSAAGAVRYTAAGDCSLEDFSRFVNSTAPESAKGDCYVEEKVLEDIGCDTVHPASTAACRLYRRQCPFRSCPAKHVLNDADLSCVTTEDKQRITNVGAAIMIVSSLAAGLLVGAAVVLVASLLRRRHLEEDGDSYKQVS